MMMRVERKELKLPEMIVVWAPIWSCSLIGYQRLTNSAIAAGWPLRMIGCSGPRLPSDCERMMMFER